MVVINWSEFHQLTKGPETSEHPRDEDRISELPCHVLIHILSFLPLKESIRTNVLKKSWRNLWSSGSWLDFDADEMLIKEEDIRPDTLNLPKDMQRFVDLDALQERFVERVNNVLRCHKSEVIDKFRIRFHLDNSSKNGINDWLKFAFARRVQTFELDLLIYSHPALFDFLYYFFPCRIVDERSNESSEEPPRPNNYFSNILGVRDFDSLRSLSLARVCVSGEVVDFFLKKCRNLERVKVCGSENLSSLRVCGTSSPALKYLEISHCRNVNNISVRHTNLVSLKVNKAKNVMILNNNPNLVQVCLASEPRLRFMPDVLPLLISGSLSTVQILTLDVTCFSAAEAQQVSRVSQLTELKQLTLIAFPMKVDELMPLTSLISLSPNLDKFVLQLTRNETLCREDRLLMKGPKLSLLHLKTVEFHGYYGREAEDELIMFFVENAMYLERIIIDPCGFDRAPTPRDFPAEEESRKRAKKFKEVIPSSVKVTIM